MSRTPIGPDAVITRNEEPVAVEIDGRVVMMSIEQGMYFGPEGVAPRIWSLLEQPRTLDELCAALVVEFEIDAAACRGDVVDFLGELQDAGLVRIQGHADAASSSAERR